MNVTFIFNVGRLVAPVTAAIALAITSIAKTSNGSLTVTGASNREPPAVAVMYWEGADDPRGPWSILAAFNEDFCCTSYTNTVSTNNNFFRLTSNIGGTGCCP